jgi:hypothetical protein
VDAWVILKALFLPVTPLPVSRSEKRSSPVNIETELPSVAPLRPRQVIVGLKLRQLTDESVDNSP